MMLNLNNEESVQEWIDEKWFTPHAPKIVRYQNNWYTYKNGKWGAVDEDDIRAFIHAKLEDCTNPQGERFLRSPKNMQSLFVVLKAHKSLTVYSDRSLPAKFSIATGLWQQASQKLSVNSPKGLINLEDFTIQSNSGIFALDNVDWYPTGNDSIVEWLKFIDSLGFSEQQTEFLQEMFGYILAGDTSQQCAFILVGPKRAGKGTIGHVLSALIGNQNVCHPSMSDFGSSFGLQTFIGKKLALFGDGHTSSRAESTKAVEDILKISSGDSMTINRKFKDPISVTVKARIIMLANELPTLSDTSDAVYSRFHILQFENQFYGREDLELNERLMKEIAGIAQWAMDGYKRLKKRGRFIDISKKVRQEWHISSDQFVAFTEDCISINKESTASTAALYTVYTMWCENNGQRPSSKQYLMRKLSAVIGPSNFIIDKKQVKGVRLNEVSF